MVRARHSKLNVQISEEAAEWFVEFRTGEVDAHSRAQFDAWVRSSPEHLRAYLEMAAIWNESGSLDMPGAFCIEDEESAPANVVDMTGGTIVPDPVRPVERSRTSRHGFAVAASLAVVLLGAGALAYHQWKGDTFTTGVGEQRSIRLDDGSILELNSRSRIRVRFSEHERRTELLEGQALFRVAKDRARPFTVRSDRMRIRAVGTQFDVNRKRGATIVTVLEGRIAVSDVRAADPVEALTSNRAAPRASRSEPTRAAETKRHVPPTQARGNDRHQGSEEALILDAGQQVTLTLQSVPRPIRTDVSAVTAWTQNQIVLESARLVDVAEELNRYSARLLVAEDHGHPQLRLSGVFSTDAQFLIRYLRERPDITIRETEGQITITRHDPK